MNDDGVRYDEGLGVIMIEAPPHVNSEVLDGFRARMVELPGFTPETPVLVDWTGVNLREVTPELVRDRATHPWPVTGRIAFYAPSDVLFGLARMYALQSRQQIEAFRTRDAALGWLAAPPGDE
jgi:hypothetical protein